MANQDTVTYGGIGKDPSGAYSQIETGFDMTVADGAVTWNPTSVSSTAIADAGLITVGPITVTNGSGTGIATDVSGDPDLVTITLTSGATMSTVDADVVINVADADSGSFGAGVISAGNQTPASNGVVQLTNGGIGANWDGTVTYKENRDEAVETAYFGPVPVTGAKNLTIYCPVTPNSEITAQFQYTDDDVLSIDGVEKATWVDIGAQITHSSALSATLIDPSDNTDWGKLDKMKYMRLKIVSTDADTNGVVDVNIPTAYIKYAASNTLESNTGISYGGIGKDPS
jgi:hypothetical protein